MPDAMVVPPGGGEIIGDAPDRRVEILCDADALHATWSRFGPGRDGASLHIHDDHSDFFYVLDGELTVRLGVEDQQVAVPAGTLVRVPPLVVHGFRNAGEGHVRYLNFHAPGCGFANYMRGLRDGVQVDFDQREPTTDGLRPASDATTTAGAGVLADGDELRLEVVEEGGGRGLSIRAGEVEAVYVLEGALAVGPRGTWARVG